jgi:two-component system response regulator (stage 0 sporulation protein A)
LTTSGESAETASSDQDPTERVKLPKDVSLTEIRETLIKLNFPPHIKGYGYSADAIKLCLDDHTASSAWVKTVYATVAKKNYTTPSRVERAIRHAIEVTVSRLTPDHKLMDEIFPIRFNYESGKLPNSEFLSGVVEYFKRKYDIE